MPWVYLIAISMFSVWDGGSTVGPRYLIPAIPFLAVPFGLFIDRARGHAAIFVIGGLILASLVNVWAQSLTYSTPLAGVSNPLFASSIPDLLRGHVLVNYGMVLFAPLGLAHSLWTLLPLVFMWVVWTRVCLVRASRLSAEPSMATSGLVEFTR
jgi:hypothetical protein